MSDTPTASAGPAMRIRVVLMEPTHPGNVGAVARAMWTMGLDRLSLVNPQRFPSAEATARAAGADELLYAAARCQSLDEALAGCGWVVGTTVRARRLDLPRLSPRECAARLVEEARRTDVAMVFGREHSGLTNEELDRCHAVASIPTNERYGSLNLAAAVQVFAYETRMRLLSGTAHRADEHDAHAVPPATVEELDGMYSHMEEALIDIGYHDPGAPKLLMRRLRRLFNRAQIDRAELNILRGILAAMQKAAKRDSE